MQSWCSIITLFLTICFLHSLKMWMFTVHVSEYKRQSLKRVIRYTFFRASQLKEKVQHHEWDEKVNINLLSMKFKNCHLWIFRGVMYWNKFLVSDRSDCTQFPKVLLSQWDVQIWYSHACTETKIKTCIHQTFQATCCTEVPGLMGKLLEIANSIDNR